MIYNSNIIKKIFIFNYTKIVLCKVCLLVIIAFLSLSHVYAQFPSYRDAIHIKLWAPLDAYPGIEEQKKDFFGTAVSRLKEIAPFLINGMVYGWNFEYTPSDKARNVSEYFEVEEVRSIKDEGYSIKYSDPLIENNNLSAWIDFVRTPAMSNYYKHWEALVHPKIHGVGHGKLEDGFDGVKTAYEDAVKNAVRDYERGIYKNKPKEISGTIMICGEPRMFITAGQYTVELDFFLEVNRIIEYSKF